MSMWRWCGRPKTVIQFIDSSVPAQPRTTNSRRHAIFHEVVVDVPCMRWLAHKNVAKDPSLISTCRLDPRPTSSTMSFATSAPKVAQAVSA
eukprot:scaffold119_cov79-Skeletonema_dohrnii-CCMP3373.AAC.2